MLLYPPMNELLKQVPSRYLLVNMVANRARRIASESEHSGVPLTEKPVSMAILEAAGGMLNPDSAESETTENE